MHFASNLQHTTRSPAIPLMAVESAAVPSDAVAGQRNDGGPEEGAAQRILGPETAQASTATAAAAGTPAAVGIPSPAAAAKMNSEAGSGTASKDEAGTAAAISP